MAGHRNFKELQDDLERRLDALPDGRGQLIRDRVDAELAAQLAEGEPLGLRELRVSRELTQTDVSVLTGMKQSEVSRTERYADMNLTTLQRYIDALGGELQVFAMFGDERRVVIDLPRDEPSEVA